MRAIRDFDAANKRILVRTDFNVPLAGGEILDDFRIRRTLPTILYLMENKAKIILMSHLGAQQKMDPIQVRLMEYLDVSVTKAPDCIGSEIEKWTRNMMAGEILLLENLRFHKGEQDNDESFAKELSKMGDVYVNDAFGACHRAHASIVGVPKFLPAYAGLLLEDEITCLTKLGANPEKPLVALIGGAKVDTKLKLVDKLSEVADVVLISGLLNKAIIGEGIALKHPSKIMAPVDEAQDGKDIGSKTVEMFKEKISQAKTIFWNGPFGKIEEDKFTWGTKEIVQAITDSHAYSVAGGGETIELINQLGLAEKFGFLSTGGGAMLEFLSGEKLLGIEALEQNAKSGN